MTKKVILFDMDGTLVSTENTAFLVVKKVFQNHGLDLDENDKKDIVGRQEKDYFKDWQKKYNISDEKVDVMVKEIHEVFDNLLYSPKVLPGAIDLVKKCNGKYTVGVVSGSKRKQIEIVLNALKVMEHVSLFIGEEDTDKGKPNPDPYLKAANGLNVNPEDCLVIEDSEVGVLSAKKAGMKVIGVRKGSNGEENLNEADRVVDSLEDINEVLIDSLW